MIQDAADLSLAIAERINARKLCHEFALGRRYRPLHCILRLAGLGSL